MKHIKIVLVPDNTDRPSGCKECVYDSVRGCQFGGSWHRTCLTKLSGGVFINGGHYEVKASVSRNKREGKYRELYEYMRVTERTMSRRVAWGRGHG